MGIFNEQSFDHPFARGIQGAPGVGFSFTPSRDYDMLNKKLRNVGAPSANTDAATTEYVHDNSSGSPTTPRLTVDSNIDMKDRYRIQNLKAPIDADEPATKQYADSHFFYRNGSHPITGDVNMNNKRIYNLLFSTGNNQPTTLGFTDLKYLHLDGSVPMGQNLNMNNKSINHLRPQTNDADTATKKYVDDAIPDTSSFIKKRWINCND